MLNDLFSPGAALHLIQGPLGNHLDNFAIELAGREYSHRTIHDYVVGAAHFGLWLGNQQIAVLDIKDRHVREFADDHRQGCRCASPRKGTYQSLGAGLRTLLRTLRDLEIVRAEAPCERPGWTSLVDNFGDYLTTVRGAAPKTRKTYSRFVADLLVGKFGDASAEPSQLCTADLAAHVLHRCQTRSMKDGQQAATALRSFARYLHVAGLATVELASGIPSPSARGASRLPEVLDDEQVATFLGSFDRLSATGQRGYAMATFLVVLGLRACEVPHLTLDDIDWRSATVRIVRGKSRRASMLPLPKEVGEALAIYLAEGRPITTTRHVFVRHVAPRADPLTASAVRIIIRRAFERAKIDVSSKGTHILRRTAATRMMRGGASIKEVADILRHRSINTTVLYARMDLNALSEVAMPWPEVCS